MGDAQRIPLPASCVDLIVTSPPYIGNAIDYMRAHKFSLVWLGYSIRELGQKRKEYIGGEATSGFDFVELPAYVESIIAAISAEDVKRGDVVRRYYTEMTFVLREVYRVLKPGHPVVMVVGTSIVRGIDSEIGQCLIAIAEPLGFEALEPGMRSLDRNRRMLPASTKKSERTSQIQSRMHEEYVLALIKP
jgi:DNA modification methylase